MNKINLDVVSKEELLQALIYMAGQYLGGREEGEIEHLFMSAGEDTCAVLAKTGVIEPTSWGGRWLIDPWVEQFNRKSST